jgi:hypothetical protein
MDSRRTITLIASAASLLALLCWLIMFLAGHDVWHDVGNPDFWKLQGPPYADMRVFAWSFYAQFFVLLIGVIVPGILAVRRH